MLSAPSGSKQNNRNYPGARCKRPDLKKIHREECAERTEVWQKLTVKQQLESLDRRGHAAKKQRARLESKLAKQPVPVEAPPVSELPKA